jgi:hypothetical protein
MREVKMPAQEKKGTAGKSEGKRPLERHRRKWGNDVKT